jgi:hypothetical protein
MVREGGRFVGWRDLLHLTHPNPSLLKIEGLGAAKHGVGKHWPRWMLNEVVVLFRPEWNIDFSFVLMPDGLMPRIGYCFCPNAGRAITFLLDEKSNQKNQAKVILPRTGSRWPGLLWLACAGIPIPSGFWGMHCSAMVENGDSAD